MRRQSQDLQDFAIVAIVATGGTMGAMSGVKEPRFVVPSHADG